MAMCEPVTNYFTPNNVGNGTLFTLHTEWDEQTQPDFFQQLFEKLSKLTQYNI